MPDSVEVECPGCGLNMPVNPGEIYDGYFNCSAACWSVFTEVIGFEFSHAAQVWKVHQLTVDSYAVQHAGGPHPDKSVAIHLSGLHLALDQTVPPPDIAPLLKRLADRIEEWPHFDPPDTLGLQTIFDVAMAASSEEHVQIVRDWAASLWTAWASAQSSIRKLVGSNLS